MGTVSINARSFFYVRDLPRCVLPTVFQDSSQEVCGLDAVGTVLHNGRQKQRFNPPQFKGVAVAVVSLSRGLLQIGPRSFLGFFWFELVLVLLWPHSGL